MTPPSPMPANLYDSGEHAYAAKMRQFASQPLERAKRRRSSGASSLLNSTRAAAPAAQPPAPAMSNHCNLQEHHHHSSSNKSNKSKRNSSNNSNSSSSSGENAGEDVVAFRVRRASGAAGSFQPANLLEYSTRSCWQSFARAKESVVLALDAKTLLSEIRILNKNACAVDVSLAVEDRPRSYVTVKRMQTMAHSREVSVKIGFIPCRFIRLEFTRHNHASIAVHGVMPLGIPCSQIEDGSSGPSLCTLLSHATENLLFGSSLRASQPYMDFLSDHRSGSPEWMLQHRTHLLDEKIARLEAALFA